MIQTDNLANEYPSEVVAAFMATMRAQSPTRPTAQPPAQPTAVIAHKTAPPAVAPKKKVQVLDAQKLAAVAAFYNAGHSSAETQRRFGVSNRTVARAVAESGGTMRVRERPQKLTDEAAREVYGRYLAGELLHDIARETGIAYTTYRTRWVRLGLPFPVASVGKKLG
jgi:transposase